MANSSKGFQRTAKRVEVLGDSKLVEMFGVKLSVFMAKSQDFYTTAKSIEYNFRLTKGWVKENLDTVVLYRKGDSEGYVAVSSKVLIQFTTLCRDYSGLSEETLAVCSHLSHHASMEGMKYVVPSIEVNGQTMYRTDVLAETLGVTEDELLATMNDPNFLESLTATSATLEYGSRLVKGN